MNKRIEFIDWIRVVACLMVMLVHASENFYGADSSGLAGNVSMLANESNRFWVSFYDGFVSRAAVPLLSFSIRQYRAKKSKNSVAPQAMNTPYQYPVIPGRAKERVSSMAYLLQVAGSTAVAK